MVSSNHSECHLQQCLLFQLLDSALDVVSCTTAPGRILCAIYNEHTNEIIASGQGFITVSSPFSSRNITLVRCIFNIIYKIQLTKLL